MNYLLDTHTLIWFYQGAPQLSVLAKSLISDRRNNIHVSVASFWEIAIKLSINKLDLDVALVEMDEFTTLPIESKHAVAVENLPFHHKDPFDRLLAVQSQVEDLQLISNDSVFDLYQVRRIW